MAMFLLPEFRPTWCDGTSTATTPDDRGLVAVCLRAVDRRRPDQQYEGDAVLPHGLFMDLTDLQQPTDGVHLASAGGCGWRSSTDSPA